MTKTFSLGAALSVTTTKGLAEIDEIQLLVEHLLDRPVLTHELGPALLDARLVLLKQWPWLRAISMPNGTRTKEAVTAWLALLVEAGLPATLTVHPGQ
jgi:hypothetical protein